MRTGRIAADTDRDTRTLRRRTSRRRELDRDRARRVEFAATDDPHVPPVTAKSPAFAPLGLPSPTDSANPDRFVTVTLLVFGDVLAVRIPYGSAVGVTVARFSLLGIEPVLYDRRP